MSHNITLISNPKKRLPLLIEPFSSLLFPPCKAIWTSPLFTMKASREQPSDRNLSDVATCLQACCDQIVDARIEDEADVRARHFKVGC